MTQVSYPGVYIREIASGVRPIAGVATSIGMFVGMTKRGPLNEPTRVFGVKQFEDIFSADSSLGELPDQVRQFFLNGGNQCFIVRTANSAQESTVGLTNAAGDLVLTLTSRDAGLDSNRIRASVDYNTVASESSFNLTVYGERFEADGTAVAEATEVFPDVRMNAAGPRFVKTIVEQGSRLVGTVDLADATVAAAATLPAFSASASLFADATAAQTAIETAITAANPAGGTIGRLRIKVGAAPWLTIQLDSTGGITLGAVESAINTSLGQHTAVTVAVTVPTADGPLRFTASEAGHDVLIDPALQRDIAGALGLGEAQGGVEVSSFAAAGRAPAALVSGLDGAAAGDLAALLGFAAADKATLTDLGVTNVRPFTVPLASIAYPAPAGTMQEGTQSPANSLNNVRENLQAIAIALSAGSSDWRAEAQGMRLVLVPTFGDATAGTGAGFTSANPDLSAVGGIFNGITGRSAAAPFTGGSDGSMPQDADYRRAFDEIDRKVDLFNILCLPKSAEDTGTPTLLSTQWAAASVFALQKRAFLIVDPDPRGLATPDDVVTHVNSLRRGVVKDHSAVYWPLVTISANGVRKTIASCGSMAGVYARTDANRGVWKAAAGLEADLRGVLAVGTPLSDQQNGVLNPKAINAIRSFNGSINIWGARTNDGFDGTANPDFRYVPVRRFTLFIAESLYRGLQWAVFEPNDEPLWAQMRTSIGSFMNNLFRRGAFAGRTASDAYFVKVDSETTTQNDINLGIVNALVGFAPLKPAEFIVITLQQKAGQVQV